MVPIRAQGSWRLRVGLLAVILFVAVAFACAGRGPANEADLETEGLPPDVMAALEVVKGLQDAMIGVMQRGPGLGYEGRFTAISAVARTSFDIPAMARASYGPGFKDLSDEQKRTWLEIYERFHISSLAEVRDRYSGQIYRILGYLEPGPGVVLIKTKLDYPGRAVDLYTDYRLRRTTSGWRIVDVHDPPSVSALATRRAEYRTVLERRGFDGLITEMKARIKRRERP